MNSIWNKNIEQFAARFPNLFSMLAEEISSYKSTNEFPFEILSAKNGSPTAIKSGKPLHSKYNPEREAEQLTEAFCNDKDSAALFLCAGLGYAPLTLSKKNPDVTIIIIEPDVKFLLHSFTAIDWSQIFLHQKLILIIGNNLEAVRDVLKNYPSQKITTFASPAQTLHAQNYFDSVKDILKANKQKEEINTNTLEKFSSLWLNNSARNLRKIAELNGIQRFEKKASSLPFVILAAGPSLETMLPHLAEIKKRAVIVCVDTALHACLTQGVEPDFIILVDPQYACSLHLEFLSSPDSILITECAVYPSVFRFKCKEIVLCSTQFPIGTFFEKKLGEKGKLAAGGSVATTAWDFALYAGATEIFIAGMDLGFPLRQTHIRGSQFEERAHRTATRIATSENFNAQSLFSAQPCTVKDFFGNDLLSDKRMELFAWWFSNKCPQALRGGTKTYTLTPQSHAIDGIEVYSLSDFLKRNDCTKEKNIFLGTEHPTDFKTIKSNAEEKFNEALRDFVLQLEELQSLSKKGKSLCDEGIKDSGKIPAVLSELDLIDKAIMQSNAKDAASLVFPTERQLNALLQNIPQDPKRRTLYFSRLIYTELLNAIGKYKNALQKITR